MQLGRRRPVQHRTGHPNHPETLTASAGALVAAGQRIRQADADSMRRLIQPWQSRAFAYYDLLGEIKYSSQFYSRALSAIRLFVAYLDDQGDPVEVGIEEDEEVVVRGSADEVAMQQLGRIRDPGGSGRTNLQAAYGRLMFLTGEGYLFVSEDEDVGREQWEMLSTDELRPSGSGYVRYRAPSVAAEEYKDSEGKDPYEPVPDGAVAYRLWRRHPRYSLMADSTMQGVLDICEELVLLTQAVRARARSRLAGTGILFLSDELSLPALEAGVGEEDPDEDLFLSELTEAMLAPIANEGAASAIVPIIVRGPSEAIDKGVKHLQIIDPTQVYPETGLRRECIERIAIGLDMPPEALTGLADLNHWTAWSVDESTWKSHLQPIALQLVGDLTAAFFQPQLRELGVVDWDRYVIDFDASAIINHPDRSKDAKDNFDRGAIGYQALRAATGFAEEDAQTDEEHNEYLGVKLRDSSLAKTGIPSLRSGSELETGPGELEAPPESGVQEAPASVSKTPPEPPTDQPDQPPVPGSVIGAGRNGHTEVLTARVLGAADLALHRAREQAGNRLRTKCRREAHLLALIDGVPAGRVAAALGPERLKELRVDPSQLVAGVAGTLDELLRMWGVKEDGIAERIGAMIESHASRTLFQERPAALPPQFTNYVAGLETARQR